MRNEFRNRNWRIPWSRHSNLGTIHSTSRICYTAYITFLLRPKIETSSVPVLKSTRWGGRGYRYLEKSFINTTHKVDSFDSLNVPNGIVDDNRMNNEDYRWWWLKMIMIMKIMMMITKIMIMMVKVDNDIDNDDDDSQ